MSLGRILVSGGNGFIGKRLLESLRNDGETATAMVRRRDLPAPLPDDIGSRHGDLLVADTLARACDGMDTVFHCAGYAHAFAAGDRESTDLHHAVNHQGTVNLLEAAVAAGVKRFIFLSSVKAMGHPGENCVDESWPVEPETPYGQAKRAAEQAVMAATRRHPLHAVNLRLAMVYGAGSRGNLERMVRGVRAGWFPPLPDTGARRSLVHVADAVKAIKKAATDSAAAGETYIVADSRAYSGGEIYAAVRHALGMPASRWRCPAAVLHGAGRAGDVMQRLLARRLPLNSEIVDRLLAGECYSPARIEKTLGWRAEVSLPQGLSEICRTDAAKEEE